MTIFLISIMLFCGAVTLNLMADNEAKKRRKLLNEINNRR